MEQMALLPIRKSPFTSAVATKNHLLPDPKLRMARRVALLHQQAKAKTEHRLPRQASCPRVPHDHRDCKRRRYLCLLPCRRLRTITKRDDPVALERVCATFAVLPIFY